MSVFNFKYIAPTAPRALSPLALLCAFGFLSSCGIPGSECGDGVVCLDEGAGSGQAATAADIASGKYAYGPDGSIIQGNLDLNLRSASTKIRDFGTSVISVLQEALNPTQSGYRILPTNSDGELRNASRLSYASFASNCGLVGSVSQRIDSCRTQYPSSASWNGEAQGLYAEGSWSLVTRDIINGVAIWKDNSTGYLWTSKVASEVPFCEAAGVNDEHSGNCDASQTNTYCAERSGFTLVNPAGLGNLSRAAGNVTWRLPTRADFLRAELSGLRYVQDVSSTDVFWTSNTLSTALGDVWTFGGNGHLAAIDINDSTTDVLCVGVEDRDE